MDEKRREKMGLAKKNENSGQLSQFQIKFPVGFDLRTTMEGHGWYDLAPFKYDEEAVKLTYTFSPHKDRPPQTVYFQERANGKIVVRSSGLERKEVLSLTNRLFRMDEPLAEFYEMASGKPGLEWVKWAGAGRLLRSATVFEDLVKTLCTTNCSWSLTKKMVTNLVELLGETSPQGDKAFPAPEAMASVSESFYRDEIKAGYRAPYFAELSEAVASGKIEPESWARSDMPTEDLRHELKQIKGVGDYAADNLLKLLGRYDGLALDSWLRAGFYKKHNRGKKCPDAKIERHYKAFGKWKGLAIWCDMTESWFEGRHEQKRQPL